MMQESLAVYFNGEKHAGLLLAGAAAALGVAAIVMFRGGAGLRPFALTLGIAALAFAALGLGLYLRTGPQVTRLDEQLRVDAPAFYAAEATRMARVQRTFVIVEFAELTLIIVCAIAAVAMKDRVTLSGIALGLLISTSMVLAFDVFAERRAADYAAALTRGAP